MVEREIAYSGNKLTSFAFIDCIVAGAAGLLLGYDTGISGGVTSMPVFLKEFFPRSYKKEVPNVEGTHLLCKFDDDVLTLFKSSIYLAAICALALGSTIQRGWGRKMSMILGGSLFFTGAIVSAVASIVHMLILGRVLMGFGIGFANQAAILYISEIAPYKYRGACNMLFPLSITTGIIFSHIVNFYTAKIENNNGWRLSFGLAAVPALIFTIGSILLHETPISLIERGEHKEAIARLIKIRGTKDVYEEFNDMLIASNESKMIKNPWFNLCNRKYMPHLVLGVCIPFFQQIMGIFIFKYYTPILSKTVEFESDAPLMSALIFCVVTVVATWVSISSVDKLGRRRLFIIGGVLMVLSQIVIYVCIASKSELGGITPGELPKWHSAILMVAICVLIFSYAWSLGSLGWLLPSEIFPLESRSAGVGISLGINMLVNFFGAKIFMWMCQLKFVIPIFFAFVMLHMIIFVFKLVPETKGIPIENMQGIWKSHPVWKKYVCDEESYEKLSTIDAY